MKQLKEKVTNLKNSYKTIEYIEQDQLKKTVN